MEAGLSRRNPNEEKKKYSIIHWQTGEPKEKGRYLVSMIDGGVTTAAFIKGDAHDEHFFKEYVTAWCNLSDIEPYKEESK